MSTIQRLAMRVLKIKGAGNSSTLETLLALHLPLETIQGLSSKAISKGISIEAVVINSLQREVLNG